MKNIGIGVIIVNKNKVLLSKRLSNHGKHTWSFPGGRLEHFESPLECAIRETREETGLTISNLQPGPWVYNVFEESNQSYLTLFVIAEYTGGIPQIMEPDKSEEWSWYPWDALPTPLFKPIQSLLDQKFDLTLPSSKYKMVTFDLDGTIILGTSATMHYANLLGVSEQVKILENQFARGSIDSTIFMNQISPLMKGLTIQFIKDHLHTLPIIGGLAETITALHQRGIITVITTTAGKPYAEVIKDKYGFHYAYGTEFEIMADGRLGKGVRVCGSQDKIQHIKALADKYSIPLENIVAVGDGISDIPLFAEVGHSIALNYQECLQGKAKIYLQSKDMREILSYL